jgi:predicted ArsR family transcriptional regulator
MDGLTAGQVADMLGITYDGARQLMAKLQAADGVPIVRVGGQWLVPRDQLIEDVAGE